MTTPNPARAAVFSHVASAISALCRPDGWVRVAVDGKSAAGKSTFATDLAATLDGAGVPTVHVAFDDFHPPDYFIRDRAEPWTRPDAFLAGAYAYDVFRDRVIVPLSPGGNGRIRTRYYETATNTPHPEEWLTVPKGGVLFVDGTFVLGPELRDAWDYVVWLDIDTKTMVERALVRDHQWIPDADRIRRRYESRWIPAHDYYESTFPPLDRANCVIDNRDFVRPLIIR